jgi:hypothetical protein
LLREDCFAKREREREKIVEDFSPLLKAAKRIFSDLAP